MQLEIMVRMLKKLRTGEWVMMIAKHSLSNSDKGAAQVRFAGPAGELGGVCTSWRQALAPGAGRRWHQALAGTENQPWTPPLAALGP
jgi:hypothetical protein